MKQPHAKACTGLKLTAAILAAALFFFPLVLSSHRHTDRLNSCSCSHSADSADDGRRCSLCECLTAAQGAMPVLQPPAVFCFTPSFYLLQISPEKSGGSISYEIPSLRAPPQAS